MSLCDVWCYLISYLLRNEICKCNNRENYILTITYCRSTNHWPGKDCWLSILRLYKLEFAKSRCVWPFTSTCCFLERNILLHGWWQVFSRQKWVTKCSKHFTHRQANEHSDERAGRLTDRQAYTRNEDRQTCRQTQLCTPLMNSLHVWRTKRSKDSESIGPFREYKRVNILVDLWDSVEVICLSIHE